MPYILLIMLTLDPDIDSLIEKSIDESYTENFVVAESLLKIARGKKPEHPAPYFFLSSLYELMWVDRGEDTLKRKIFAYCDTAMFRGKKCIQENEEDAWCNFFLGGAYTIRIFYYLLSGDFLSSITYVRPALKYLRETRRLDPNIVDVKLGLGGWKYFKGNLPFLSSDKEEGLKMIRESCKESKYVSRYSALAYAKIAIREEKYEEALEILNPLMDSLPDSRTFLWPVVKCYYGMKEFDIALSRVEHLIEISADNPFSLFESLYYKTKILMELSRVRPAYRTSQKALKIRTPETAPGIKREREELREIKKELERKLGFEGNTTGAQGLTY